MKLKCPCMGWMKWNLVVRSFFLQNDLRAAIIALRKLSDLAVHADVSGRLMDKMDSVTLDLLPDLLPVLLDLLFSNTERHINVSLELLLKFVAVFGPVVNSTVTAPPTVVVDLHAEKRLECCHECNIQLQKIHKCLPDIISRGGVSARRAQELKVILNIYLAADLIPVTTTNQNHNNPQLVKNRQFASTSFGPTPNHKPITQKQQLDTPTTTMPSKSMAPSRTRTKTYPNRVMKYFKVVRGEGSNNLRNRSLRSVGNMSIKLPFLCLPHQSLGRKPFSRFV
ncbi:katanin p80 WD40 repeat-containing subunit B1 homolog KTN80.2-like isoform X2 [Rutidosis leptorrhynchoides]|uniref:katanin p80 WD40 repeat-containing subunit B1 homolog KTN80.2-like isoform X2 n=1 Tax=Rutidosis leptorrhynchoides TaxID=125765 RepID=UPI003A99D44D